MRGSTCPWTECRSVTISMVSHRIVVKQENGLLCLSISLDRHDSVVRIYLSDIISEFGALVAKGVRLMRSVFDRFDGLAVLLCNIGTGLSDNPPMFSPTLIYLYPNDLRFARSVFGNRRPTEDMPAAKMCRLVAARVRRKRSRAKTEHMLMELSSLFIFCVRLDLVPRFLILRN
ncbi:hypothetical protein THAOC_01117 [Thalassiosira oceanica]|uniref:Uncharacterized protein n=1 Tax=Thalassiosira oceanica TaxID=159749 RepID=K0TNF1_THAOC|nr:hypothetical protein THAOC_01117 [Thalassiosira oceanica]|eukprot:EJK77081.1 hypothetical protein THAOC_01117 [Thalassiosira oceanica]